MSYFKREVVLSEAGHFDQAQMLLWAVKPEANTTLGQHDVYGLCDGTIGRADGVELGEPLRLGLDAGQDIVERGAEDCSRKEWLAQPGPPKRTEKPQRRPQDAAVW